MPSSRPIVEGIARHVRRTPCGASWCYWSTTPRSAGDADARARMVEALDELLGARRPAPCAATPADEPCCAPRVACAGCAPAGCQEEAWRITGVLFDGLRLGATGPQ